MSIENEPLKAALYKACKYHDWYYQYSDDNQVYRNGVTTRAALDSAYDAYAKAAGKAAANAVYNSVAPVDYVRKTD